MRNGNQWEARPVPAPKDRHSSAVGSRVRWRCSSLVRESWTRSTLDADVEYKTVISNAWSPFHTQKMQAYCAIASPLTSCSMANCIAVGSILSACVQFYQFLLVKLEKWPAAMPRKKPLRTPCESSPSQVHKQKQTAIVTVICRNPILKILKYYNITSAGIPIDMLDKR